MEEKLQFLESLRTYVKSAGATNLEEAEKLLGIHRNTVRTHLQRLNHDLDCEIISSGVTKTEAGRRIEAEAKRLLDELEASLDASRIRLKRLASATSPVQVAMSSTIWMWGAEGELLPLTHSLTTRNAIEFLVANSERVERAVADGWFELGVTARQPNGEVDRKLNHETFCDDEILLAVPPKHEWASRESVTAEELCEGSLITLDTTTNARRVVDREMERRGLQLADPHEEVAMAVMAFEEAISSGVPALVSGLAFESPRGRAAVDAGVRRCTIDGPGFKREFLLVYANRLREEAQTVKEVLANLPVG
jgi:DNA-binding transcriptional LysR family regulator